MGEHNKLGKEGEDLAVSYLIDKGFSILHRNWRYKRNELDIIAKRSGVLHFVEVKSRRSKQFPEDSVSKKKFNELCKAADEFLYQHQEYKLIQFDIISINVWYEKVAYFFIEDVYL